MHQNQDLNQKVYQLPVPVSCLQSLRCSSHISAWPGERGPSVDDPANHEHSCMYATLPALAHSTYANSFETDNVKGRDYLPSSTIS